MFPVINGLVYGIHVHVYTRMQVQGAIEAYTQCEASPPTMKYIYVYKLVLMGKKRNRSTIITK